MTGCTSTGCEFAVESELIRDDGAGGIVEVPELLKAVNATRQRVVSQLEGKATVGPIIATPGKYAFLLAKDPAVSDLLEHAVQDIFLPTLVHATSQVRANAQAKNPLTLSQLGITRDTAGLLQALTAMEVAGASARLLHSGVAVQVPCPTKDELSAIAQEPKPRRYIDGVVTGIGRGDGGARIEINESVFALLPGLEIDEAIQFLKQTTRISAYLAQTDNSSMLEEAQFSIAGLV